MKITEIKKFTKKIDNSKTLAILSLVNRYFWKTKVAPIMSIVLPFTFMVLYYLIGLSDPSVEVVPPVDIMLPPSPPPFLIALPSFLSLTILPLLFLILPQMHVDFKNSILLRKIKISNINKIKYIFLVSAFFTIMSFMFTILTFLFFMAFASEDLSILKYIDWGGLVYGILMTIISGISIGFFVGIVAHKPLTSQLIGFGIILISMGLGGQLIPIQVIGSSDPVKILSFFSPLNYSLALINTAIIPEFPETLISPDLEPVKTFSFFYNNIFDFSKSFQIVGFSLNPAVIYEKWHKVLNVFVPLFIISIFSTLSYFFFKWTSR